MLFVLHDIVSILKLLNLGFEAEKQVNADSVASDHWFEWPQLLALLTGTGNMSEGVVLFLFCMCGNGMDHHLSFGLVTFEIVGGDVW